MEYLKSKTKHISDSIKSAGQDFYKSTSITRPWLADFLNPSKFSKPYKREACRRISENLKYYLKNYIITELLIICLSIISQPLYFVIFSALAFFWYYFSSIEGLKLAGREVSQGLRSLLLGTFTMLLALYMAWELIISSLFFIFVFAMIHATYHELPPSTTSI
ncbi:hypothetical protein SteCoe_36742 [Stentor coeruleus]|uniref:PRA1 family protein n=1 Tax=Stentor coeruleus TaxID=5963 RepID=A0A1R2APP5_9CILI|nr:hypothetical protein SteCoe_36742 [Stentor coeruleus]